MRTQAEHRGIGEIVGGVDVAAQPRPTADQFDEPGTAVSAGRIRAERGAKSVGAPRQQYGARAVGVGDEGTWFRCRSRQRIGEFGATQSG